MYVGVHGGGGSLVRVYNFWDGMDGEGWGRICLYYLFHSFICDLMDRRSNLISIVCLY